MSASRDVSGLLYDLAALLPEKNPRNPTELKTSWVSRVSLEVLEYRKIPGPCRNTNRHCSGVQLTVSTDLSLRIFGSIKN
jgi:hypothetical protein